MAADVPGHAARVSDEQGEPEQVLPGGLINAVVRIGDTVRRPRLSTRYVRDLLRHLERCGWPGAPRWYGVDDRGREVLSFIDGHVPWEPEQPPEVSEQSLVAVAELVRQFHDLTAGTELAGEEEVACHNDLSPKNTVYRDLGHRLRPIAFIDWDIAAPGARIHDVAHVCWQYVGLGPGSDVTEASHLIRAVADGYGLMARTALVETILWWQDRCWRGIEAAADAGQAAMVRLRARGAVEDVRAAHDWTSQHRSVLERALT